jgi:YidC/Oxa1 family membrane protein insertase
MDKNSITGLLLIGAIMLGWVYYSSPSKEELAKQKNLKDSIALVSKLKMERAKIIAPATPSNDSSTSTDSTKLAQQSALLGAFASTAQGTEQNFTLENELIKVTVCNKGGRINTVELNKYKTYAAKPVVLFTADSSELGLSFLAQNRNIETNSLYFKPTGSSFKVVDGGQNSLSMRLYANNDSTKYIEYLYTLKGNSYDIAFKINVVGMNDIIAMNTNSMNLNWKIEVPRQEKNIDAERIVTTIYHRDTEDKSDYLSETKDSKEVLPTKTKWISFKQQYFTSILTANDAFDKSVTLSTVNNKTSETTVKHLEASLPIPYGHSVSESFGMQFYFGPNNYKTLKAYDLGYEKQIPLGWGIFGWVNKLLVINIFHFLDGYGMNYGIIILLLTVIIKVILLPLTYKAYQSQAKMKVLKPEVDEINTKYAEDALKKQQEQMALYKKAGVSPLGGCLPMVLQMPILIALFRFFPSSIELRQQSFLWAHDLSTYDSIYNFGFKIPFYGDHISLFTILMTVSTLIYTRMNNQFTGANEQMKWMSYLMPIVFLGVFNNYAAGLSYYYFLANMFTFGQQYLF